MPSLTAGTSTLRLTEHGTVAELKRGARAYLQPAAVGDAHPASAAPVRSPDKEAPLIRLLYSPASSKWDAMSWTELCADRVEVHSTKGGIAVASHGFGGKCISAKVDVLVQDENFEFRISVENQDAGVVVGVVAPIVEGFVELGQGVLYAPIGAGKTVQAPFDQFKSQEGRYVYPAPMSAQFLTYNTGCAGWALYCLDSEMRLKSLHLGGEKQALRVVQYCFLEPGKSANLPPVVLRLYEGAWHAAAEWYRRWFESWAKLPVTSPLVKKLPLAKMVVVLGRPVEDPKLTDVPRETEAKTYAVAVEQIRAAKKAGCSAIHVVGWHDRGHDSDYPEFRVSELMGGQAGMQAMAQVARQEGMSLCYYLNAHLGNVKSALYNRNRHWGIKAAEGHIRQETWGSELFDILCPKARGYQLQIIDRVLDLVENYGADSVQLDQVAACESRLCFDKTHGHATPATAWIEGYSEMLSGVISSARKLNPRFWIWIEGVSDATGQFADVQMATSWRNNPGEECFFEIYRYTFPRHFLIAEPFLGGVPFWQDPAAPAAAILTRHAALFSRCRFMDRAGLLCDPPALRAAWYRSETEFIILAQNKTGEAVTGTLSLDRRYLERQDQPVEYRLLSNHQPVIVAPDPRSLCLKLEIAPGGTDGVLCRYENPVRKTT